jgi:very-short-patch-repair endonuclease/RecA/RadA recombinase
MRSILHTLQLRLTNLSQANRSLRLGRLSLSRDIDLHSLGFLAGRSPEDLLRDILAGREQALLDAPDPRFEPANRADRRLNQIWRTIRTLTEETGASDFHLGYPFVEGRFLNGAIARCPVVLFPLRLRRDLERAPRWSLQPLPEEPPVFNRTFFLAYEQFQPARLPAAFWEQELPRSSDWLQWVQDLYTLLRDQGLAVNFNPRLFDQQLHPFPDYLASAMEQFRLGVLTFQPQAVLGLFPQSDTALLHDYERLAAAPEQFQADQLLDGTSPPLLSPPAPVKEEDRYFLTELDHSQEEALLKVREGRSLVIHGPPGTGKSQVIVNLVADAMAHGKRVLVVSQKRAALDVVYRRLERFGLGDFAVLLHDYQRDRSSIYAQLRRQIEGLEDFRREIGNLSLTQWEHDYRLLSRQADQASRRFEALFEALVRAQPCGLSVHELYLRAGTAALPLPLDGPARRLDLAGLEALLAQLRALLDYRDLLIPPHPWQQRLSFALRQPGDLAPLDAQLEALPAELDRLRQQWQPLAAATGEDLFNEKRLHGALQRYRQASRWLERSELRQELALLFARRFRPASLQRGLEAWKTRIEALDACTLLRDEDWGRYEDLIRHREASRRGPRLSLAWLRARYFWGRILRRGGQPWSREGLARLFDEAGRFEAVQRHYARHFEHAFWADCPLLGGQAEKKAWLARKSEALLAWGRIRDLDFWPGGKPRFGAGGLDRAAWAASLSIVEGLEAWHRQLQASLRQWEGFLAPGQIAALWANLPDPAASAAWAAALRESCLRDFGDLCGCDRLLTALSGPGREAWEAVQPHLPQPVASETLIEAVRSRVFYAWIAQAERAEPLLAEVSGRAWPREGESFRRLLSEKRGRVAELVARRVKEALVGKVQYNRLKNPVTFREIHHQLSKKRRVWPLRRLVEESWEEGLPALAPCWLASPESVSAVFPMEKDLFDLVIFDEASQCFVERALPVLLRGRQFVVAGDEQQLPPSDLYRVRVGEEEAELADADIAAEAESILDLARLRCEAAWLTGHYRSRQGELIRFSNEHFYEGRLEVIPPPEPDVLYQPPIRWVRVPGEWRRQSNLPEAERVLDEALALLRRESPPSIGIVTFNYPQQELIRDRLEQRLPGLAAEAPALAEKVRQALDLAGGPEQEALFVKNIENVQGDERDVILFSVGYGPDEAGRLQAQLGWLSQEGGEKRLNVAITRARRQVIVFASFDPAELPVAQSRHEGPRLLQAYLFYAQAVSEGRPSAPLLPEKASAQQNPLAEWLAASLAARGYRVARDWGSTRYRLDLAVGKEGESAFRLGVECEGPYYFNGDSAKEREVYRPEALMRSGWKLYRVWARNFWLDPQQELERIIALVEGG